jgi:hypothetical protein
MPLARGKKCGDVCRGYERERDAEKERDGYNDRIAQARAKDETRKLADDAERKLTEERTKAERGRGEIPAIASMIAVRIDANSADVARNIDMGKSILLVIGMLAFASMIKPSLDLIVAGWNGELIEIPEPLQFEVAKEEPAPVEAASVLESPAAESIAVVEDAGRPVLDVREWAKSHMRQQIGGKLDYEGAFARYAQDAHAMSMATATKHGFTKGLKAAGFEIGGRPNRGRYIKNAALKAAKLSVVR